MAKKYKHTAKAKGGMPYSRKVIGECVLPHNSKSPIGGVLSLYKDDAEKLRRMFPEMNTRAKNSSK